MAEVQNLVRTRIPTAQGEFLLYYYSNNVDGKEHIALVKGDVEGQHGVLVRLHSECFTGDVLGSRRCDCGEQLNQGLNLIGHESCGVLIYLRLEQLSPSRAGDICSRKSITVVYGPDDTDFPLLLVLQSVEELP